MKLERSTDGKPVLRFQTGLSVKLGNLWACVLLCATALVLAAISVGVGTTDTGLWDLMAMLTGTTPEEDQAFALWDVRLPRLIIGFMAGWCIAIAGAILQSIARNPLADPGLLGLSQGAMLMIILLIVFAPDASRDLMPFAAIAGGLCVAMLLIWIVGGERSSGLAILLMGIAVETVLSSVTSILILYSPQELSFALSEWVAGSLFEASWNRILSFAPWFALSFPAIFLTGQALRSYGLGEEMAMALGEPITRSRPLILFVAVLLSSAAVTAVGPLIFLGVMAPHIAGFLSPATGRARLILSGLMGGVLVIAADMLTRAFAGDLVLPIGLSIMIVGVPMFIIALRLRALRNLQRN